MGQTAEPMDGSLALPIGFWSVAVNEGCDPIPWT